MAFMKPIASEEKWQETIVESPGGMQSEFRGPMHVGPSPCIGRKQGSSRARVPENGPWSRY